MSDIDNYAIKSALENEVCVTHNANPVIEIVPTGIEIKSCCEEFQLALREKSIQIIREQTVTTLQDAFRNSLKG